MEDNIQPVNADYNPKFELQNKQYDFPYHYIAWFDENDYGKKYRFYGKGYEYLCYVKHVLNLISEENPKSVLEIGCGDGRVIGLIENVETKVGIDLSAEAIAFAKAFHPEVDFHVKDASEYDSQFEVVIAVEVLEHIPDQEIKGFIKTLENRCKADGKVIITVPSKVKPLIEKHYRHYDADLFKKHLEMSDTDLKIEKIEYIFKESRFIRLYRRLTANKYWIIQLHSFERFVWNKVWKNLRKVNADEGQHLVVTLRKD